MHSTEPTHAATAESIALYAAYLRTEERSDATIAKYVRDLWAFFTYLADLKWVHYLGLLLQKNAKTFVPLSTLYLQPAIQDMLWMHCDSTPAVI